MREKVLASFAVNGSTLRLVIATTAFGIGVNCKDILYGESFTGVLLATRNNISKKQGEQDAMDWNPKLFFLEGSLEDILVKKLKNT